MSELENVFTKGTKTVQLSNGRILHLPSNEDWAMSGTISAYDAAIGKVSIEKVFDEAVSKTIFYAQAKYMGLSGTPGVSEVDVGANIAFYRVGKDNINFTSLPTEFQLDGDADLDKASFVSFFFP